MFIFLIKTNRVINSYDHDKLIGLYFEVLHAMAICFITTNNQYCSQIFIVKTFILAVLRFSMNILSFRNDIH